MKMEHETETGPSINSLKESALSFNQKNEMVKEEERELPAEQKAPKVEREAADDFGVSRRIYLPYFVYALYVMYKTERITQAETFSEWLVECVDLATKYGYRRRLVLEEILSFEERTQLLKKERFSKEELQALLRIGYITPEEYEELSKEG